MTQQKLKGETGPTLKEKEHQKKRDQERLEKEKERQRVKQERMKRINEDKSSKGLDQIDPYKLREFQEKKLRLQMEEEMLKRQRDE